MNLEDAQKFSFAVAQELRRIRQEKGLSQLAVAQKSGLSRAAIQHIEKGIRNPTLMVCQAIASSLEISLSAVIQRIEKKNS